MKIQFNCLIGYQVKVKNMQGPNTNIDQSVKVRGWDSESPTINQHTFFQRYSQQAPEPSYSRPHQQYQIDDDYNADLNFRQMKNQQLEKLKGLKSEYQQIRKITTDYMGPKYSQTSSVRSSNIHNSSQSISVGGHKVGNTNGYMGGTRQTQILELEKKQLEIMLENSMKKIQQLLHNQMQNKKTIHELRLQKESKNYVDPDNSSIKRIFKKRQKQMYDQIKILELERETLLSNMTGLREKVKYLESKLSASDQQLRKMLDQKRNYQELIRMEKDKYMNLQIEFKRERRQFQIMQKDKNAQIQQLQRFRDVKQSSTEKQLKQLNANLEEQLKTKEKRYVLLLQQLETLQKDKNKDSKEQEAKIMSELISKSGADNSNKAFQDTLNNIMSRLNDLENKPQEPVVREMLAGLINEEDDEQEKQAQLEKLQELNRANTTNEQKINTLLHNNRMLENENQALKVEINTLTRKIKTLQDSQLYLKDQIYKLRQGGRKTPNSNSREKVGSTPQKEESSQKLIYLMHTIENLEDQIKQLNDKLEDSWRQRDAVDEQNRNLLTKMSRMQFEMGKGKKEAELQLTMARKQYDTYLGVLQKELQQEKIQHQQARDHIRQLKGSMQQGQQKESQYIIGLKKQIEAFQREKNNYDTTMKARFNNQLEGAKENYKRQIDELTTKIKDLSMSNKNLQEKYNRAQVSMNDQADRNSFNRLSSRQNMGQGQNQEVNSSISEAIMLGFT